MIKIEDIEVMGMRKALKGMRNSMNSWDKSDSYYTCEYDFNKYKLTEISSILANDPGCELHIGEADMNLAKRLIKAGSSESKHMRMIHVQADVTAPLYWWKEYDTYKVSTTANSCSTMHTLHTRNLELDDFSHDNLVSDGINILKYLIDALNDCREAYINYDKDINHITKEITSKKHLWWQMIQLLPSSYNQMRTIDLSYETLAKIYRERKNHKLDEWHTFCDWILTLPYMKEFLEINEE
ncbi:hypothetical protein [Bullifex porci]|uniref:hypothetical protein n=1 Tax=Bullifex porci TaxID=2606638 RepID=UPI0023F12B0D|nr:hypothetical protein [Bullifex porci]MDD7256237.1 hypothetical protein [Bullifex porci]